MPSNLYPPIFDDTFTPAFIYTKSSVTIYYKISQYNQESEIYSAAAVQIAVQDLKTNKSVLNKTTYPSNIKISSGLHSSGLKPGYYYFQLEASDIEGGSFKLNTYYKLQIRFTGVGATYPPSNKKYNNWLNDNAEYFSEWSTVTLLYTISQPTVQLNHLQKDTNITLSNGIIPIVGKVSFENGDTEQLKNYQIQLYDNNNNLIEDSQKIFPVNTNEIYYILKANIKNNIRYKIVITYITQNLYTFSENYLFHCDASSTVTLPCTVDLIPKDETGEIQLTLISSLINESATTKGKSLNISLIEPSSNKKQSIITKDSLKINDSIYDDSNFEFKQNANFTIRRTSSLQHFNSWEDIYNFTIPEKYIAEIKIKDYTIEPGVWYKYSIIREYNDTIAVLTTNPYMVYSEDIFLSANNKQLKIRFDPQINNFSIKTTENLVETIGSQYPFVYRNSNIYYKTFSLSGLITYYSDYQDNLFTSEDNFYSDIPEEYADFKLKNKVQLRHKNYIYEKDFRNEVIKFLYDNNIKLFRSLTQGNMLVKLSNISLTPNNSLGRLVYSFSCTVYEIDKANNESYQKYYEEV